MSSTDTDDSGADEYDDNCDDAHWACASLWEMLRQSESPKQHSISLTARVMPALVVLTQMDQHIDFHTYHQYSILNYYHVNFL